MVELARRDPSSDMAVQFTSSWDDGHPLDRRVADLLSRHDCPGTFYVPCANRRGMPVMSPRELRALAEDHEVASHTFSHCYLDRASSGEARREVVDGKSLLEDRLGQTVRGFAYPGGRHDRSIRRLVREAGFSYARTVESFSLDLHRDPFLMPTTLQLHPHDLGSYTRNLLKQGRWAARLPVYVEVARRRDLGSRLARLLDRVCRRGGVLHLWGHSWEIDQFDLWSLLDDFLGQVTERIPPEARGTNGSLQRINETRSESGRSFTTSYDHGAEVER